jgi:hypothetical protein
MNKLLEYPPPSTPAGQLDDKERDISEAASEKPKRGRPPKFDTNVLAIYRGLFPEVTTTRGLHNVAYRIQAVKRLKESTNPSDFLWLVDRAKMSAGPAGSLHAWRPELLSELGRVRCDENFFSFAAEVCREKPNTKLGVRQIRALRLYYEGVAA